MAAWLLLVAVVVAGVVGVVGGILSPSLVVDLVAVWPLLAVALLLGVTAFVIGRRKGRRSGAVLPLGIFTALVLSIALHLGAWDELPSASTRLTGPDSTEMSDPTELVVQIAGEVVVEPEDAPSPAYQVEPILRGGRVGVPSAEETSVDGAKSVVLTAADAPGWYSFSGWQLDLSTDVVWRLVLNGRIDADLTGLELDSATFAGSGIVRLGMPPDEPASLIVAGDLDLLVPPDASVVVDGAADIPGGWDGDESGSRSPEADGSGPSWNVSIQAGGNVTIREG